MTIAASPFHLENSRDVERPTSAVIDLGAISHNVSGIRKKIGNKSELMAVVKADAYGHGSVEISLTALKSGADSLAVALPAEGQRLRAAGIDAPILVLGPIQPEESYKIILYRLEQTLCSLELAEALDQEARKASVRVNVHVKVDTGMSRIGLYPGDVSPFLRKIRQFRNLDVVGIFSHFSSADQADKSFSKKQIEIFDGVVREIELTGFQIPKKHMANSAAVLDLPKSYYGLVRPGIMIYGLYPSKEVGRNVALRPAMTLRTRVSFVRRLPPGTPVSYGRTFVTNKETAVATLPVGYGDGYNRLLTEHGEVLIKGRKVPVIGRICMDMCMVDVSGIDGIRPGEEVILFGENLPVDEMAEKIGTISYEIVCSVNKRVPRIYV